MKVCMIVCCPVYIVVLLMLFNYRCVSGRTFVWSFAWLCVLSWIYCCTSCIISLYVCVSERMCMKVCMIVCFVLYILSYVLCYFIIGVCQWEHVYESLDDCVLSCIYCRTSYVISLYVCQWEQVHERLYDCVLSCIYCRTSYVISL